MNKLDFWPFPTQLEYDTFNSHMKGESRNLKDAAILAWLIARKQRGENDKES